ncbi:hypothetical protein [Agromyces larvae]|uniref:Uncharacterized protein n=1 Tax=Agromyces larvae TaxID=2929802 RepID=A0ABY4C0N5_9MICO|nr:hypothetical protein [Agromyces larvae]UOE44739.1 hypothetical protein MTO99_02805 [Agromyces larvae]
MPIVGAGFGVLTSVFASVGYLLGLRVGTRNPNRSVPSLALIGAGSAAAGAALLWIGVGVVRFGPDGVPIWGFLALVSAALAAAIAGPSTSRAARDAEDAVAREESVAEFEGSGDEQSADRLS